MIENILEHLVSVLRVKRRDPHEHFVDNAAKAPPVGSFTIRLVFEYFRCQILGSPSQCLGSRVRAHVLFGEPKIGDFEVAVLCHQNVLRLQAKSVSEINLLSIHDLVLVEGLEAEDNVRRVELCSPLLERFHVLDVKEHFSTVSVL